MERRGLPKPKGGASPSPSGGGDVQIGCGWESVVVGLYTFFEWWGCAWWGSDMGCWDNGKGEESGPKFNV